MFYTNLLRYLYTLAYYLAVPGLLLRLWWRSVRYNRDYRARWQERFGYFPKRKETQVIWVHAVSMGETLAAVPLVKALLKQYPTYRIIMTSTTPTGSAQVVKNFGDQVTALYTPYDLPGAVKRFYDNVHPVLGIILETELWPNLLAEAVNRKIPLMLANARLSARSCRGYQRIAPLVRQMVNSFSLVAAQGRLDAERFLALGLEPSRLQITGNIKFDVQLPADLRARGAALRAEWGPSRSVWAAVSTHEGEETIILEALKQIRVSFPEILLILVPRHPERFSRVHQICEQAHFTVALRSRRDPVQAGTQILLGDTMGEVMLFYAAANLAFVGGSLVPVGGHNLIEPAVLGLPVLSGPQLHNFVDISQLLLQGGGASIVNNADELSAKVIELLSDPLKCNDMGQKAQAVINANTGALAKHLHWIQNNTR